MLEREPHSTSDDPLKEILGFDPESGERVEDRSGLKSIKDGSSQVPQEIQAAFIEFTQRNKSIIEIHPERLLTIEESRMQHSKIERAYHFWNPSTGVAEQKFNTQAKAWFGDWTSVMLVGEQVEFPITNWQIMQLSFFCNLTFCTFQFSQRELEIHFNERGFINHTRLITEYGPRDWFGLGEDELKILSERGHLKHLARDGSPYELTISGQNINLVTFNNEDKILVPWQVNREEIIQKLFDPLTIEDPIDAPPELDYSWRFANLMEVVGVKWERY